MNNLFTFALHFTQWKFCSITNCWKICIPVKITDREFRSNPALVKQYIKTVNKLRSVEKAEQLFQFHGLNYEKLKGNLKGYSSVRINQQYRLIFEEVSNDKEPFEIVLFKLEEISKHYE